MKTWIDAKDPGWVDRELYRNVIRGDSIRIGSGQWLGSGIRYQVDLKPDKIKMSKEAQVLSTSVGAGLPIFRSGKLKATIVKERLHIRSGPDVFVFTRY